MGAPSAVEASLSFTGRALEAKDTPQPKCSRSTPGTGPLTETVPPLGGGDRDQAGMPTQDISTG